MSVIHICSFTTGIDDMKRAAQRDPREVLAVLDGHPVKRFSCFAASANPGIAKTMTLLFDRKLVRATGGAYPWTEYEITEAGIAVLNGGPIPEPPSFDLTGFVQVGKRTWVAQNLYDELVLKIQERNRKRAAKKGGF